MTFEDRLAFLNEKPIEEKIRVLSNLNVASLVLGSLPNGTKISELVDDAARSYEALFNKIYGSQSEQ